MGRQKVNPWDGRGIGGTGKTGGWSAWHSVGRSAPQGDRLITGLVQPLSWRMDKVTKIFSCKKTSDKT